MTNPNECTMCRREHGVDGWDPRHQPVLADGAGESLPKKEKQQRPTQVAVSPWPFDPVLRQALMDKGVLVPQDLRDAEDKIRAITSATMGVSDGANRSAEGRTEGVARRD
jgi:hypothetical protein